MLNGHNPAQFFFIKAPPGNDKVNVEPMAEIGNWLNQKTK